MACEARHINHHSGNLGNSKDLLDGNLFIVVLTHIQILLEGRWLKVEDLSFKP